MLKFDERRQKRLNSLIFRLIHGIFTQDNANASYLCAVRLTKEFFEEGHWYIFFNDSSFHQVLQHDVISGHPAAFVK
jgi:hypothetical protein